MTNLFSSARTPLTAIKLVPLASLLIIISASGCSGTRSCLRDFCAPFETAKGTCTTERQARRLARDIWDCHHAQCYLNNCNYQEVREGFIAGFVSTCAGGNTCPPMFAPAKHSLCGLNKRCSTAWHEGWPLGSVAAESSGYCNSCCSRAHPCLRGPKLPCNAGCVPCGNASMEYGNEFVIDSFPNSEVVTESSEYEHHPEPSAAHAYEAPIVAPVEPEVVAPVAPEAPAAVAPEAAPAPAPPAPDNVRARPFFSLPITMSTKTDLPIRSQAASRTTASIAGIQDAEVRIATLIERFQQSGPDHASF